MKTLSATLFAAALCGCASTPTALDRTLFNVQTNFVEQVTQVTNTVNQIHVITVTNTAGETVTTTNVVTDQVKTFVTNQVPQYVYVDKPIAVATARTAGGLLGGFMGVGGLATTALLGAYHIFQSIRNKKVTGALVQGIETAKEVMTTTPQGEALTAKYQAWLVNHQAAAGVLNAVAPLVTQLADNDSAKIAAQSIAK